MNSAGTSDAQPPHRPRLGSLAYLLAILAAAECAVRANTAKLSAYDARLVLGMSTKEERYRGMPAPDLCLLGSSRADQGLRSGLFHGVTIEGVRVRTAFNYGIGGGLGPTISHAIAPMVEGGKLPKLVIWEVPDFYFNANYHDFELGSNFRRAARSGNFEWLWSDLTLRADTFLEKVLALYRFRQAVEYLLYDLLPQRWHLQASAIVQRLLSFRQQAAQSIDGDGMVMGGRCEDRLSDALQRGYRIVFDEKMRDYRIDPVTAGYFQESLAALSSRGVKVILLHMPVSESQEKTYQPGWLEAYGRYLSEVASQNGISYLDLSRRECGLTDADYCDQHHLNAEGSSKFSQCLVRRLGELGRP